MPRKTQATKQPIPVKKIIQFEFNCFENLIFFAKRFIGLCQKLKIKSDLYSSHGKYIIILHSAPKHTANILKFMPLVDNSSVSALDIAITREHAKLITSENAIEKINGSF